MDGRGGEFVLCGNNSRHLTNSICLQRSQRSAGMCLMFRGSRTCTICETPDKVYLVSPCAKRVPSCVLPSKRVLPVYSGVKCGSFRIWCFAHQHVQKGKIILFWHVNSSAGWMEVVELSQELVTSWPGEVQ